ncbi:synaptic vesicle glycoprotein 2C-like [Achroia grisella]|uniref:synaptic vesicle glycoprotein 2C-like n=1 Tax=Achroia grisella TaxID=688607 RepID=UPI0027D316A8|nr:synaptic vesicle glycoprotein 2C-like [Achroia grisella]
MAEEQASLVRARSDSENSSKLGSFGSIVHNMTYTDDRLTAAEGSGDPGNTANTAASPPDDGGDGESGELLDYNDTSVLEQFHEDALRQAGCGLSQLRVLTATGLAAAGASLELAAIPFILPSAEMELCILPHEKNWLVLISLVGGSLGAVGWGVLAERLGRRRTLLSCLAVNAVFAAIAAFMPTYGTFMMARFCSAIGSGGVAPAGYPYAGEVTARGARRAALAAVAAAAAGGALLAPALAAATLPLTGASTLVENKEHFSAWHRYLLLCTLPILASLISMIWTPESPRYLLEVGREVDAMMVYQRLHAGNVVRACGRRSECRLAELALPGKRPRPAPPAPALAHVRHSVKMFWQAFFQLFSSMYRTTTLSLTGILFFTVSIQFYLSSYIPSTVLKMANEQFEASKTIIQNTTLVAEHYNLTLENVEFTNVTFVDCAFRDMLMSHVTFKNCSFDHVAFANIKSSYTVFMGSTFVNSTIIDTDIEVGRELDPWCVLRGTIVRGVRGGCARHADLAWRLAAPLAEHRHAARAALLAALLALLPRAARPTVVICGASVALAPALYLVQEEHLLYIVEAAYRGLATLVFFAVVAAVVHKYPANLRCTALGLVVSAAHVGGAAARAVADAGPPPAVGAALVAALALAATGAALAARTSAHK